MLNCLDRHVLAFIVIIIIIAATTIVIMVALIIVRVDCHRGLSQGGLPPPQHKDVLQIISNHNKPHKFHKSDKKIETKSSISGVACCNIPLSLDSRNHVQAINA